MLEEFHGFKRQIYFNTSNPWQRPKARCELCDVLFVVYSTNGGLGVRMTLLQAKLSRSMHTTNTPGSAGTIERQEFKANFEQWDLLSSRPTLMPTTVFAPPTDLLSSALLPTVGSFGVFHQSALGPVDLFYVSADCLAPTSTPAGPDSRIGTLSTKHGVAAHRTVGTWDEVTYCPTAFEFARSLYEISIGTPIVYAPSAAQRTEYQPQLNWVRGVLAAHIASTGANAPIARTLLAELGPLQGMLEPSIVPTVVALRSEAPLKAPQR